ncbi:MAG: putative holin [Desulfovibrio sp.]
MSTDPKENTVATPAQQPEDLSSIKAMLIDLIEEKTKAGATAGAADLAATVTAKAPLLSRLTPRMLGCLFLAGVLVAGLAILSPQQLPVAAYKLSLLTVAGYVSYWLDRWCFPYARPDSFLTSADWRSDKGPAPDRANHPVAPGCENIYAAAMLRRALIIMGGMLAMGLGL